MKTGELIGVMAKERGISLRQLAIAAKIPYNTVYAIVRRKSTRIDSDTLQSIADALGVPISQLTGASLKVKDKAKPWISNKAGRLYMPIDTELLDNLEQLSKEDGLSLEDEIEGILHDEVESRTEDK